MQLTIYGYAKALFALLPSFTRSTAMIAGGALRAYYDKTPVADVDLCFRSNEDYERALAEMHAHPAFRFTGTKGRTAVFKRGDGLEYNLVGFMPGTPQETIGRFDFRCCRMVAWLTTDGVLEFLAAPGAINDAVTKTLIVLLNNGTGRTIKRVTHYQDDYGYVLDLTADEHLEPAEPEQLDLFADEMREDAVRAESTPSTETVRYLARVPRARGGYGED